MLGAYVAFTNIRELELKLINPLLEYNLYRLSYFEKLKKFNLVLSKEVYMDLENDIKKMIECYNNLEIMVSVCEEDNDNDFIDEYENWDIW